MESAFADQAGEEASEELGGALEPAPESDTD